MIVTGVGGTGIVTIGAIPGHGGASGRQGLRHDRHGRPRQKGGAVYSHIRLANTPEDITGHPRAGARRRLVLGGDLVVAGTKKVLTAVKPGPRWWW